MSTIYHYASMSEALQKLKEKGFTFDYNKNIEDIILHPENYSIHHVFHYEGNSNPDDQATVYGIVSKYGLKGVFVTGTAANSSHDHASFISNLNVKDKKSTSL
ncbi:hypothetical protein NAT47_11140 [Flavobacterium sp. HXWNR69]|uniref:Phosphoribosylpyrophosphate synthetase n=1 Tax=Flavobacterium fragile TaxID=2949085 RepID=A0ABT0TKT7_9FLAO|nr:hypothetical protein [Flavobacterium sp. HXWNR69]MCL9770970.1 hypothetical protein [Flavobacterium sp. HXWNR69]